MAHAVGLDVRVVRTPLMQEVSMLHVRRTSTCLMRAPSTCWRSRRAGGPDVRRLHLLAQPLVQRPPLAALMRELSMLLVLEVATVLAHKAPTWHMLNVSTLLMREL